MKGDPMSQLLLGGRAPQRQRRQEGGFAALVVVLIAATLATLSVLVIDFGKGANRVATEKQLLDSHGTIVGQQIIHQGLAAACSNGEFTGETSDISEALFGEIDADRNDRTYRCEPADPELITREEGDPNGPAGTFRRYRVSSSYSAFGDDPNNQQNDAKTRSVIVEVREISGEVERPRPQIMFVLDYSGSMSSNGRASRLKNAMQEFINAQYEVDYGVILFDSNVRTTIGLGSGANHDSLVKNTVNNNNPSGGTAFYGPLRNAIDVLNVSNNQFSYVVLVSDGVPGDGSQAQGFVNSPAVRQIDPNICTSRSGNEICHTIYTLGVDGANMSMLESLSGNASNQGGDFAFQIASQDTLLAFQAIVSEILCSFGPIEPQPSPEEEANIRVFLNDQALVKDEDYEYDRDNNAVKLYDFGNRSACTTALENDDGIVIRYGKPRVIPEGKEYER
jgi:uncharacterized protein YegL